MLCQYLSADGCPLIFPDGLTVHCTDKAGQRILSYLFYCHNLIISLTFLLGYCHQSASPLIVRVRCYQLTWSVWSLQLPALQFSSSHFTEHQSFTESFVLPRGSERREKCEGNTMCDVCPLWTLTVTETDNVCWTPSLPPSLPHQTPDGLCRKFHFLASSDRALATS